MHIIPEAKYRGFADSTKISKSQNLHGEIFNMANLLLLLISVKDEHD
jgi:hypothetical protein